MGHSTPDLCAETLKKVNAGITSNSKAINAIANAVVSQIMNDPEKIASIAAVYAVDKKVDQVNSNLNNKVNASDLDGMKFYIISYDLSKSPNMEQISNMLERAFRKFSNTEGIIFHSDQGWQVRQEVA